MQRGVAVAVLDVAVGGLVDDFVDDLWFSALDGEMEDCGAGG